MSKLDNSKKDLGETTSSTNPDSTREAAVPVSESVCTSADVTQKVTDSIAKKIKEEDEKAIAQENDPAVIEANNKLAEENRDQRKKEKDDRAKLVEKLREEYADIIELLSDFPGLPDKDWRDVSSYHYDLSTRTYPEGMGIDDLRRELDQRKTEILESLVLRRYSLKTHDDSEGLGDWQRIEKIEFKLMDPSCVSRVKAFLNLHHSHNNGWQIQEELGVAIQDSVGKDYYFAVTDEIPDPKDVKKDFQYHHDFQDRLDLDEKE